MSSGSSHPANTDARADSGHRNHRHEHRPGHQKAHPQGKPSHHHRHHNDSHHNDSHRAEPHRAEPHGAAKRGKAKRPPKDRAAPFTLGHNGRQVRIGPVAFWTVVGTLVIMAGWSVVTATYFAFQDDVLARMVSHEAEMQSAYEDRIAEMRAQVDRVTSRQLLDQEQLDQKLDQIVRRQSMLEQRSTTMGAVSDPATTGSTRPPRPGQTSSGPPKAAPISAPALFRAPRDSRADAGGYALASLAPVPRAASADAVLAHLSESLDRIEGRQSNTLASLEESFESKARRMRSMLSDVGIDAAKRGDTATGGPFVSYRLPANAGPFEKQVYRINVARAQVERLTSTVAAVPLRRPVMGEIDMTSSFGVRIDPFLGRPAMHTGIDFRGDVGEAIHVTAAGTVVSAGWSGGYGRMVEVDHGHGLSTRYGHLSEIDVQVGQALKPGQIVGRMGSTGRSTGPHLHYETRVDGEAVDPHKFLNVGTKFGML